MKDLSRRFWFVLGLCFFMLAFTGCGDSDDSGGDNNGGGENNGGGNNNGGGENNGGGDTLPTVGGPCGDITNSGKCYGNSIYYCEDDVLQSYDCTQISQVCGVLSDDTHSWQGCTADNGNNGGGDQPGDLNTAEDWARARIAGTVSTEAAFQAISEGSGFPVITDDNTVIFMHKPEYDGGNWGVAGDFNGWSTQAMTQNGDIWYAEINLPDDPLQDNYYKFVNNGAMEADHWSQHYTYTEDGEISYLVAPNKAHLMRWPNFKSPQGLATRTVRAYVPAGDGPFDIIYAHDGQNLFGPGAQYGSWKVEDNMAKIEEKMEAGETSFIIVGIDNANEARLSEYAFADEDLTSVNYGYVEAKGADYAKFVHETIRPFMEARFSLTGKTGLMGSSMGGLISLYIAHLYPTSYDVVLALSPTTAWGRFSHADGRTIEDIYAEAGHRGFALYLDSGGYPPEGGCPATLTQSDAANDENNLDCYCFTRSFVDKMDEIGYEWNVDLFHHHEPGALHNESEWAKRLEKPLTIFKNYHK